MSCVDLQDLSEYNIEIIRNLLYKAYLEDFYDFCQSFGGTTAEVMGEILDVNLALFELTSFCSNHSKLSFSKLQTTKNSHKNNNQQQQQQHNKNTV